MKRHFEESENESVVASASAQRISTLQEMVLHKIVSAFKSEESLLLYLALVPKVSLHDLLCDAWRQQQEAPLVTERRKLCRAELVIHYMDRKETRSGILCQTRRTHVTPIAMADTGLMEYALQKLQLKAVPSKTHRNPKFLLY